MQVILSKSAFQSTLSARRATAISIKTGSKATYFNPRSPRGERRGCFSGTIDRFLISIHALREESDFNASAYERIQQGISIHALREESDLKLHTHSTGLILFQSTLSARRATELKFFCFVRASFQSTLSARRATAWYDKFRNLACEFQSTLSARRATDVEIQERIKEKISIHALREESDICSDSRCH